MIQVVLIIYEHQHTSSDPEMFLCKSLQPACVQAEDGRIVGLGQIHQSLLTFMPNVRVLVDLGWNNDLTLDLEYLKK